MVRAERLRPAKTLAAVVAGLVLTSCAHEAVRDDEGALGEAGGSGIERVVITGSHIPERVETRNGMPVTTSPVRIYSREELDRTGEATNLGTALSQLDPDVVTR